MEHAKGFKNKQWNLEDNPQTNREQVDGGKNRRDVVLLMERQQFGPTVVGKATVINAYGDNFQCPKLSLAYHSLCHAVAASQRTDTNAMQQITRLEWYGNVL